MDTPKNKIAFIFCGGISIYKIGATSSCIFDWFIFKRLRYHMYCILSNVFHKTFQNVKEIWPQF